MFVIPENLPTPLLPIAWLLGRWEGTGVVDYPTMEPHRFRQVVEFSHDGRPFLEYHSRTWLLDDDGNDVRPLAGEQGYWRVVPSTEEAPRHVDVEVLLVHPTGVTEIYLGQAGEGKVEMSTDVVARTETAKEYTAGQRLYGHVHGDLMWVFDMAAVGQPMTSHASAQLHRADLAPADAADEAIDEANGEEVTR